MNKSIISDYLNQFFDFSPDDNNRIISDFMKNKTILDFSSPDLKYEIIKFTHDNINNLKTPDNTIEILNQRGITQDDLRQLDQQTFLNKLIYQ
mgnify:CR=1 FL=1